MGADGMVPDNCMAHCSKSLTVYTTLHEPRNKTGGCEVSVKWVG